MRKHQLMASSFELNAFIGWLLLLAHRHGNIHESYKQYVGIHHQYTFSFVRLQCLRKALYLIVLFVLQRNQFGNGLFCLCFLANRFFINKLFFAPIYLLQLLYMQLPKTYCQIFHHRTPTISFIISVANLFVHKQFFSMILQDQFNLIIQIFFKYMSYQVRANDALKFPSEQSLIRLIREEIESTDVNIRAKQSLINALAQFYVDNRTPEKIKTIATNFSDAFAVFSKPRMAKITKNLGDYIAKVPNSQKLQIQLNQYLVQWCIKEKRTYLKNRIQLKLAGLYLEIGDPSKATQIIDPILSQVRKADDKLLLVELYLLQSKINYFVKNFAKAKASLTASRANANNVYCQPITIAEIDLMSGILYAQDQDYKTAYSYFYEALEPLIAAKDNRAMNCFKYMILCKIMSNNKDDVNSLINGKFGLKYTGDSNITAMKMTADAHFKSSIVDLIQVFKDFKHEIEGDEVVKNHTKILYDKLLENNLFKIIESYTRVDLSYIAKKLSLTQQIIERKLSEMILDRKIAGTLDQSKGCLIVYHEPVKQKLYDHSSQLIENLLTVVQKLSEARVALRKQN